MLALFSLAALGVPGSGVAAPLPTDRIVGGHEAPKDKYKFVVSLHSGYVSGNDNDKNNQFCGGSLIAPGYVLTAAHCFDQSRGSYSDLAAGTYVRIANHDLTEDDATCGDEIGVEEIIIHENYDDFSTVNDIAILKLSWAYTKCPAVIAAVATIATQAPAVGTMLTVAGWGRLYDEESDSKPIPLPNPDFPNVLMEVDVAKIGDLSCSATYGLTTAESSVMFCAGNQGGGQDSCQGDSGGPIFIWVNNKATQVGIVSHGISCADSSYPGVYTKAWSYNQWVGDVKAGSITSATNPGGPAKFCPCF